MFYQKGELFKRIGKLVNLMGAYLIKQKICGRVSGRSILILPYQRSAVMTNKRYQHNTLQQQAIPFTSFRSYKSQHHQQKRGVALASLKKKSGVGKEKVSKRFLFLNQYLDFQPTSQHKGDPSWRHHPVVKAKVSKVSPPLPSEGEGALPGTNTSSTDPETSISLLHISQPYWSTLGRKAKCTSPTDGVKKLCTQCQTNSDQSMHIYEKRVQSGQVHKTSVTDSIST